MQVNGKEYNIEVLQKEYKVKDLDKDIKKKRKNGLPLRDSHIEVLKRYKINYEAHRTLNSLLFEREEAIRELSDNEELEYLIEELVEINYYNYTNK